MEEEFDGRTRTKIMRDADGSARPTPIGTPIATSPSRRRRKPAPAPIWAVTATCSD
jgi:hypothetical protein